MYKTIKSVSALVVVYAFGTTTFLSAADQIIRCESKSFDRRFCPADTRRGVSLRYQYSESGCWQGETWGYDSRGIWVANGCRADFSVRTSDGNSTGAKVAGGLIAAGIAAAIIGAASSNDNNDYDRNNYEDHRYWGFQGTTLVCASDDMRRHSCRTGGRIRYAEVSRQHSQSPCSFGQTWGYARDFIWVDRGCRAEFTVR